MKVRKNHKVMDHSGSTFDSFLEQEGIREEVEAVAIKRVLAWQLEQAMQEQQKTKQAMAKQLRTSRSQLDRLLGPSERLCDTRYDHSGSQGAWQACNHSRGRRKG